MTGNFGKISLVGLKRPTIFAHRGSSAYAPENTLAAYKLAVQQCADAIELDAKCSADGQVVVIHDDTVDRTTNGSGHVATMTLSELKNLDAGSYFAPEFSHEKIPTLDEVFETLGNQIFINIELKNYLSPMDDLPDRVISLVKKHGLEENVLFSSFNFIALIRARFLNRSIPLGYLAPARAAGVTVYSRLVRFGQKLFLHPFYGDVNPDLINILHRARSRIHAYTLKEADDIRHLVTLGVDGIITSDPLLANSVISEIK